MLALLYMHSTALWVVKVIPLKRNCYLSIPVLQKWNFESCNSVLHWKVYRVSSRCSPVIFKGVRAPKHWSKMKKLSELQQKEKVAEKLHSRTQITYSWLLIVSGRNFELFCYLFSISCFMSMPCFSRSSLWANVQSTGSEGVSADGVFSLSARACSGWLNLKTWFLPMMIRFPKTGSEVNSLR